MIMSGSRSGHSVADTGIELVSMEPLFEMKQSPIKIRVIMWVHEFGLFYGQNWKASSSYSILTLHE